MKLGDIDAAAGGVRAQECDRCGHGPDKDAGAVRL